MANKFLGVGVNFGVASTGITGTNVGTFKLQSRDHAKKAKIEDIADADGRTVQRTVYDEMEEATFEYVISGSSTSDATTQTKVPDIGDVITVTDTTKYTAIAGTSWIVDEVSSKGSNTTALRINLKLVKFSGISGATS